MLAKFKEAAHTPVACGISKMHKLADAGSVSQEQYGQQLLGGQLKPIIHATFPLEQAPAAHQCMEAGENFGKIVLMTQ